MINITLLTGPSGSGNSSAKYVFEELGYYVSENIPSSLVSSLVEHFKTNSYKTTKICIMVNVNEALQAIQILKEIKDIKLKVVVLSCEEKEILKRYTLTRHVHPRSSLCKISLEKAIKEDVKDTIELIPEADIYIDTTSLSIKELRRILYHELQIKKERTTTFTFISYGLKNGVPLGLDCSFDVRLIPNPYWVEALKELNGQNQEVIDYMMSFDITQKVLDNLTNYLSFLFENIVNMDRGNYNIGIACSGGQHRSTFVANYLANYFKDKYNVLVIHRDCQELNNEK